MSSRYLHDTHFVSDKEIEEEWARMSDMKRWKIIQELRQGRYTGWGNPDQLRAIDEFRKLPVGLQKAFSRMMRGEDWGA